MFDDAVVDVLSGASGSDWFFAHRSTGVALDIINGLGGSKLVEELGVLAGRAVEGYGAHSALPGRLTGFVRVALTGCRVLPNGSPFPAWARRACNRAAAYALVSNGPTVPPRARASA